MGTFSSAGGTERKIHLWSEEDTETQSTAVPSAPLGLAQVSDVGAGGRRPGARGAGWGGGQGAQCEPTVTLERVGRSGAMFVADGRV